MGILILMMSYRYPYELNRDQYNTLIAFKERINKDGLLSDFVYFNEDYLLRFCRARKFDLEKMMKMFTTFIKWRKEFGTDEIESWEFPERAEVKKYYPHGYHKTDKLVLYLLNQREDLYI